MSVNVKITFDEFISYTWDLALFNPLQFLDIFFNKYKSSLPYYWILIPIWHNKQLKRPIRIHNNNTLQVEHWTFSDLCCDKFGAKTFITRMSARFQMEMK